jgi:hypothetical protein
MANALYNPFKQELLSGSVAWDLDGDVIKAVLIDSADYTFSAAHSDYATEVAAAAKVAVSAALGSPTVANGVFDTADFSWTAVSGDPCEAIILEDETLTPDRLMTFYDTGMTGMPVTPNGGNINVTVNGSGWFAL